MPQIDRHFSASLLAHAVAVVLLFLIGAPVAVRQSYRATPLYLPAEPAPASILKVARLPKLPAKPANRFVPPPPQPPRAAAALPPIAPPAATLPVPTRLAPIPPALAAPPVKLLAAEPPPPSFAAPDPVPAPPVRRFDVQAAGFDSTSSDIAAKPSRGDASSSGLFGDAAASSPAARSRRVSAAQFDSAVAAASTPKPASHARTSEPIEILAKPKPAYTEEARRLRIQGEVVLEVLFRASAQVSVLRVVRALGHGLDASAEQAAMGIRFQPAMEGGHPIDAIATVKIEFQLAD